MSSRSTLPSIRPFRDLPVRREGNRWLLLAAGIGTVPADSALTVELDGFAVAMAAADRAVAALNSPPRGRR
jgi:hypothetical protein